MAELGMRPTRLFDTELAGRLLNYPRVGLAVLVEELLGYSDAQGALGRRLVEASVAGVLAPVRRARCRGPDRARDVLARQLEEAGKAQWAAAGVPGLGDESARGGADRPLAPYLGHPPGQRPTRARRWSRRCGRCATTWPVPVT